MNCMIHQYYVLFYRVQVRRSHYVYCLKMLFTRKKYVSVQKNLILTLLSKSKMICSINIYYLLLVNMDENLLYIYIYIYICTYIIIYA